MNYVEFVEGRKEEFVNLEIALQENGNFVVKGDPGVGKLAAIRGLCEQFGFTYAIINCLMTEDITAVVKYAVNKGTQVIVIDEPNRISLLQQEEVFQIFEELDVKVVININPCITCESELNFEKWMKEHSVKVVEVKPNFQ